MIFDTDHLCPICDELAKHVTDEDCYTDSYYYCCSMKPFYHMYKANNEEQLYLCNEGKIVVDSNIWTRVYSGYPNNIEPIPKVLIQYKNEFIRIHTLPEFDMKNLSAFIKAAINNVAFL